MKFKSFFMFLALCIFIYAMVTFSNGFKNMDYSTSILKLSYYGQSDLYKNVLETGVFGEQNNLDWWYMIGLKQLYTSFILFILSFIILFFYLLFEKEDGKKT